MSDHFDINNTTSGLANKGPLEALIGLKDLLVAAGGSVEASSRGRAGSYGSGDTWSSASIVNQEAWCVINLADGVRQVIFQNYHAASWLMQYWGVFLSIDGSYTTTGESQTQCGTPTNYETLFGPELITGTISAFFYATGYQTWHAFARSDGSFWFFDWTAGATRATTMISVDVLGSASPTDADPAVYTAYFNVSGLNNTTRGLFNHPKCMMGYVASPYAGDWNSSPAMALGNYGTVTIFPDGTNNRINPHNSKWDILPVQYGLRYNITATPSVSGSYKGRSSLFGMTNRATGTDYFTTLNVTVSKDRARIHPLVLLDWPTGADLEY